LETVALKMKFIALEIVRHLLPINPKLKIPGPPSLIENEIKAGLLASTY
jgi:hypothetical protein